MPETYPSTKNPLELFRGMHPDNLKRSTGYKDQWTFIYGGVKTHDMYIIRGGTHGGMLIDHEDLFRERFWAGKDPYQVRQETGKSSWDAVADHAVLGRVLEKFYNYMDTEGHYNVISFWDTPTPDWQKLEVQACQEMLSGCETLDGYRPPPVNGDWVVTSTKHEALYVKDLCAATGTPCPIDQGKKYEIGGSLFTYRQLVLLRTKCHTGSGPEKAAAINFLCKNLDIKKYPELESLLPGELCGGGSGEESRKPTWQSQMKKHGFVTPGQKWWAPTSDHAYHPGMSFREFVL